MISKDLLCCETYNMNHLAETEELIKNQSMGPKPSKTINGLAPLLEIQFKADATKLHFFVMKLPLPSFQKTNLFRYLLPKRS